LKFSNCFSFKQPRMTLDGSSAAARGLLRETPCVSGLSSGIQTSAQQEGVETSFTQPARIDHQQVVARS
jgi:hypothetical protein